MIAIRSRLVLALVAVAAFAPLAVVFAFEWWGGVVPCALCLVERWPYRIAIALAVVGFVLPLPWRRAALALILLAGLADVGLGFVHQGVEFKWWPSPLPECAAPHFAQGSIAQRLKSMPALPSKPCDDPVYAFEAVPLSFSALNMLYALAFSAGIATVLIRTRQEQA